MEDFTQVILNIIQQSLVGMRNKENDKIPIVDLFAKYIKTDEFKENFKQFCINNGHAYGGAVSNYNRKTTAAIAAAGGL